LSRASQAAITQAKAELWRFPLAGATGGSGITAVDVIVVELEDALGRIGTGFSYVLGASGRTVRMCAADMLERFVLDSEWASPPALWRRLASSLNRTGRGTGYLAIAAIDLASWDLWSKQHEMPLYLALGGESRSVPVYGSGGFGPAQAPDAAVQRALEYVRMGCSAVKLRFAGNSDDIVRLHAVAEALPENVRIMGDLNEKCDLATARWFANECADYNLYWLEEPLPADDVAGYAALAAHSPVPIATGEHHQGLVELGPFFDSRSCAVVQPDLAMTGGLTEAMRVATVAGHFGVSVAPHFLPALFVHLACASPAVRWLEHFPLLEPLFDEPVQMDGNGEMKPPETPGHGLNWAPGARDEFFVSMDS
jgi:L-alanine-DL-glutamate epimerase-like enolase superfamily enzyme